MMSPGSTVYSRVLVATIPISTTISTVIRKIVDLFSFDIQLPIKENGFYTKINLFSLKAFVILREIKSACYMRISR